MPHLNSLLELTKDEIQAIFSLAARLKEQWRRGERRPVLQGRVLTQVFEKPSLRTRVSFEAAMMQLGGGGIFLSGKEAGLEGREALCDVARVLSGYSDVIVLRTFSQKLINEFCQYATCPIINGLSDDRHPCQALTDFFTMQEFFGDLQGRHLAFIGDGNNVARSLAAAGAVLGVTVTICSPEGYQIQRKSLERIRQRHPQAEIRVTADCQAAVRDADIIYTDVWCSMGQESQADVRKRALQPYQVNADLMAKAPATARFMHCLPARRGHEVTDDVLDSPQSVAFEQAENRMHLAKGLLLWVLEMEA